MSRMSRELNAASIGVGGGIGPTHARIIEEDPSVKFVAVSETNVDNSNPAGAKNKETIDRLSQLGTRHYLDYREMLEKEDIDVLTIAVPHFLHYQIAMDALERGIHVFCEKPVTVTYDGGLKLLDASRKHDRLVSFNYEYLASGSTTDLLTARRNGFFGENLRIVGTGLWTRTNQYYDRANWAGQVRVGDRWGFDGIWENQLAHLIEQALRVASPDGVPNVKTVSADLFRGHSAEYLELADTSCLQLNVGGIPITLYGTTCHAQDNNLSLIVIGDKGCAAWTYASLDCINKDRERSTCDYGTESVPMTRQMYKNFLAQVRGEDVKPLVTLEEAIECARVTNLAYMSSDYGIEQVPRRYLRQPNSSETGGKTANSVGQDGDKLLLHDPETEMTIAQTTVDAILQGGLMYSETEYFPFLTAPKLVNAEEIAQFDPNCLIQSH